MERLDRPQNRMSPDEASHRPRYNAAPCHRPSPRSARLVSPGLGSGCPRPPGLPAIHKRSAAALRDPASSLLHQARLRSRARRPHAHTASLPQRLARPHQPRGGRRHSGLFRFRRPHHLRHEPVRRHRQPRRGAVRARPTRRLGHRQRPHRLRPIRQRQLAVLVPGRVDALLRRRHALGSRQRRPTQPRGDQARRALARRRGP